MPSISEPADRPLRADAERNRRRILEAAADEFAERGIGVTMDAIAARAGVGVGTVYRRFPEKSELLAALFEEKLLLIAALADEALEREDEPWEALVGFIERGSEFQAENRAMRELLLGSAAGNEFALRARAVLRPKVAELVRRAQETGELRADIATLDVPMIQQMIATVMDFTAAVAPETWRRMLQIVIDGLARRPGAAERAAGAAARPGSVRAGDGGLAGTGGASRRCTDVCPKRLIEAPVPPDPGSVDDLAQFDPRRRPRRDREPEPGLPAPLEFKPVPPVPLPERGREPRSTLRRPGPR